MKIKYGYISDCIIHGEEELEILVNISQQINEKHRKSMRKSEKC